MRRTFSHESNNDSQLGEKIRNRLEVVSSESTTEDLATGAAVTEDATSGGQSSGFETPKAVGTCSYLFTQSSALTASGPQATDH
jgi:hypothetical protein